jgi:glycosyltransferase involved in cell wall biosynthesis
MATEWGSTARFAVAHLGARMHYAVPCILHAAGRLELLYTDIVATKGWPRWLVPVFPGRMRTGLRRRLAARVPQVLPAGRIVHFPGFALQCARRQHAARSATELTAAYLWAGAEFCRLIIKRGLGNAGAIYAFNSAALELLRFAKERGLATALEQTLPPWSMTCRIVDQERQAWPGWEPETGEDALAEKFTDREQQEWRLADTILCASEFVVRGTQAAGGPVERCRVVPYGVDGAAISARRRSGGALRVLFCGAVGLRKGIPHLLQAAKQLPAGWFHFRLVGPIGLTDTARAEVSKHAELLGAVPRRDTLAHYQWADVFVLPTLCEGSATVCYEALAAGLPVITTPNAGSVVRDGVDGFIVPIRNSAAIAEKLELLAAQPQLLEEMSRRALDRSTEFTLERYGERLLAALDSFRPAGV